MLAAVLADHPAVDMLVNNAGRSIRRSVALSYDRFHDYERTIRLNYLGTIRLVLGLLPHMRERKAGHIVNVSSIGVQASPPRFSAYVASKAALDAFTRVVSSETIGDNVTFTTIHMPLVRTPMIAPTKLYDSLPDDLARRGGRPDLRGPARAARSRSTRGWGRSPRSPTRSRPKAVDRILHMAYKVFPESSAARGDKEAGGAGLGRGDRALAPHARGALVTRRGSIAAPRTRISKCRCGPVERPGGADGADPRCPARRHSPAAHR